MVFDHYHAFTTWKKLNIYHSSPHPFGKNINILYMGNFLLLFLFLGGPFLYVGAREAFQFLEGFFWAPLSTKISAGAYGWGGGGGGIYATLLAN